MEVSKYNFSCQKAFHKGLQLAQGFGHQFLEVEHIAISLLNLNSVNLPDNVLFRLKKELEQQLAKNQRVFGKVLPKFGLRLDHALDRAERSLKHGDLVNEVMLWEALVAQSSALKIFFLKEKENKNKQDDPEDLLEELKLTKEDNKTQKSENETAHAEDISDGIFRLSKKHQKTLDQYTLDLNSMAERGELDPVIGRDAEVRRVLEILGRKKKNNPVLIGEAGVGKTAIAEAVAIRIVAGQVPESMYQKRILALNIGLLLAGAKYRGEVEERLRELIDAIKSCDGKAILFIDELHMIVGAGGSEGTADIANHLKPELARGVIRCFGATTLDEYRVHIEKDPALERRFQPILVEEPNAVVTLSILRGLKSRYETHHGVIIEDEALIAAVELSKRYLSARRFPDKAIDLIDEACSRVRFQIDSVPAVMDELKSKISALELEKKAIKPNEMNSRAVAILNVKLEKIKTEYTDVEVIWREHQNVLEKIRSAEGKRTDNTDMLDKAKQNANYDFAAKLQYAEIPLLAKEIDELKVKLTEMRSKHTWLKLEVNSSQVAEVVALWSHIPVQKIQNEESTRLMSMEKRLKNRIFGQDSAINLVSKAIKRARAGINDANRPLGVFLFCGPTGVGKTETVKALAAELFDDEKNMVRIDMSEYMEKHNVSRLIGSPPGYVGYGEGGELTEAVRRRPFSVVLFDEIEKAHVRVLDVLLQVFEDGRLTDGTGNIVDFKNTLIVMTSNLPVMSYYEGSEIERDEQVRVDLSEHLRPEFVNRLDEIVVFQALGQIHLQHLVNKLTEELNLRLIDRGLRVTLGGQITEHMIQAVSNGQFGGRALRRIFQSLVVDSLSEEILDGQKILKGAYVLDFDQFNNLVWNEDSSLHKYLPQVASAGR